MCRELASDRRRISGTRFKLVNPVTNLFAGYLRVSLEWASILQPVRLGPPAMPLDAVEDTGPAQRELAPLNEAHLKADEAIVEISVLSAAVQVGAINLCILFRLPCLHDQSARVFKYSTLVVAHLCR
jgi:hypothetical protein